MWMNFYQTRKNKNDMDLNKLSQEAFETAKAHGWHDEELPDETYLILIITEIAEAVQADRKNRHADIARFKECMTAIERTGDDWFMTAFAEHIDGTVECEFADVVIRILDFSELRHFGFDSVNKRMRRTYERYKGNGWDAGYTLPMFCYTLISNIYDWRKPMEYNLSLVLERLLVYCKLEGIDIDFFVEQKMRYNKLREFKHGNKKY